MKTFFLILAAMLTGKYWKPSWALERAKKYLYDCSKGQGYATIMGALSVVTEAYSLAGDKACDYIAKRLSRRSLISYFRDMGLLPEELLDVPPNEVLFHPGYQFLRDRFVDDVIRELKQQGM